VLLGIIVKAKKLEFPKDELPHNKTIEWWYFNGHLKDSKGNKYAFMNCLFRADAKKSKLPFIKRIPYKYVYFTHSIFSDIKRKKFYIEVYPLAVVSKDSFTKKLLCINWTFPSLSGYLNHSIEEAERFRYKIKSEHLDLMLNSKKRPFLEGKRGFLNFGSKSTYYYSLTNLDSYGEVIVGKERIKVKGKSWMDHQWANVPYAPKDKWSWFGIQLNNDVEIIAFEYITENKSFYFGGIIEKNGRWHNAADIKIIPLKKMFKSRKTGAVYPTEWRIEIPSKEIMLKTRPLIGNQEVLFGAINYLENPIEVFGKIGKREIRGNGFTELVGYPIKKSISRVYEGEIKRVIEKDILAVKKNIRKLFKKV